MEKEILLETRNVIDNIYKNGINETYLKELYRLLGNNLIPFVFLDNGAHPAAFDFELMYIYIDNDKINKWLDDITNSITKQFNVSNEKLLKSYLISYALCYEIEHSDQKLIADGLKTPGYDYEKDVYYDIYNVVLSREYSFFKPITSIKNNIRCKKYKGNEYNFIVERNAIVEGYNILSSIAELSNDKEMLDLLITLRNMHMLMGYYHSKEGSLKYTYNYLGMMKKYNNLVFPNNMPLEEKVRRGLELTQEERDKVVLSLKQTMHFKKQKSAN